MLLQLAAQAASAHFKVDSAIGQKEISREVVINDTLASTRHHLTKRTTQEDIQRRTNTIVVTKGKYQAPGMILQGSDKPLHLRVTPGYQAGLVRVFCVLCQHLK